MPNLSQIPLSVLDLSPILAGGTAAEALRRSLDLAQHAERWGYRRFWVAEHHNMPGIASAATAVVIGHIARGTATMRVGSGGIMLPNHAPLVIAEQFGTLDALFPGRIDLGLGRAPGTDQVTARALRRDLGTTGEEFPALLEELRAFLGAVAPGQTVRAIPGQGAEVELWLLGSGGFSAQLAGELGLPFASAGHFAPENIRPALEIYRQSFRASAVLDRPRAMVGLNVIAAATDAEAAFLASSHLQAQVALLRGHPQPLPPPVESMAGRWSAAEEAAVTSRMRASMIGSAETVRAGLERLVQAIEPDELIIHNMIYDHAARLRSYEILAGIRGS